MSSEGISHDLRGFIAEHIDSVVQLEVLLLLAAAPDRDFSADEIAKELRIDAAWSDAQLAQLCARGLLNCTEQEPRQYRYAPKNPSLRNFVAELAQAYADRRVAVISLIYSKPPDALRSFADAFRLRKDRSDG